jgi:putative addiction module killer protein
VIEVRQDPRFREWLLGLRDLRAAKKINQRLIRLAGGLIGDAKYFDGIGELRVDYGPGYRIYFVRRGNVLIIILCGGDKSTQARDLATARALAKEY